MDIAQPAPAMHRGKADDPAFSLPSPPSTPPPLAHADAGAFSQPVPEPAGDAKVAKTSKESKWDMLIKEISCGGFFTPSSTESFY